MFGCFDLNIWSILPFIPTEASQPNNNSHAFVNWQQEKYFAFIFFNLQLEQAKPDLIIIIMEICKVPTL